MIFLFGSARSGSTWLGKIFDSHPDLLYLHEPDIPDRGTDLIPFWFAAEPTQAEIGNAGTYLNRLAAARNTRTIGIRPFFAKNYRGAVAEAVHRSLIYGAKSLERLGLDHLAGSVTIPDLARKGKTPRLVIKSVSALGRAEAFLEADASVSPVLLIRHPCAYVASMLRGKKVGGMSTTGGLGRLAATRAATRLKLEPQALDGADEVTLLSWAWLLSNAEAYPAIRRANGTILIYEELAADPVRHIKNLFARLALGWPDETADFLARSQESEGDYYSVFRDSSKSVGRWRDELDRGTVDTIRAIVGRDPIGAQFFSDH